MKKKHLKKNCVKTVKTNHFLQHKVLVFASVYGICLKKKAREKVVRSNQNTSRNKIFQTKLCPPPLPNTHTHTQTHTDTHTPRTVKKLLKLLKGSALLTPF